MSPPAHAILVPKLVNHGDHSSTAGCLQNKMGESGQYPPLSTCQLQEMADGGSCQLSLISLLHCEPVQRTHSCQRHHANQDATGSRQDLRLVSFKPTMPNASKCPKWIPQASRSTAKISKMSGTQAHPCSSDFTQFTLCGLVRHSHGLLLFWSVFRSPCSHD